MLNDFPDEILYFILSLVIEPYNNYYFLINQLSKRIINNYNYKLITDKKIICYYCKKIHQKNIIIKNGDYCSLTNKPLCNIHFFICKTCNKKHDFYQHSFLNDSCIWCKFN